jgi:cystathionine beta-lyase/cystathionine gamma-synthase
MGSVTTLHPHLASALRRIQNTQGAVPSPFDCYQVLRGMKTLDIRMRRQSESAARIASILEKSLGDTIERVNYPTLTSQPPPPSISNYVNLDVGWGGVVSFELKSHLSTHSFCSGLKLFKMAESLGAVESLVEVPFEMMGFPSEEKVRMG